MLRGESIALFDVTSHRVTCLIFQIKRCYRSQLVGGNMEGNERKW